MAKKKTVMKVPITCTKCQTDIMKAVAKLEGIEKMEVDANKGTLTIIGEIEPVPIFKKLKKIGKQPEIVSVGPPRPKCPPNCTCSSCRPCVGERTPLPPHFPFNNKPCDFVAIHQYLPPSYDDNTPQCNIM